MGAKLFASRLSPISACLPVWVTGSSRLVIRTLRAPFGADALRKDRETYSLYIVYIENTEEITMLEWKNNTNI